MPTVDILPIANNPGAFVETQADYVVALAPAGRLVNGYPSGILPKEEINKTLRQSSMVAAAVANFIANTDGADVLDDGDLAALITRLTDAITSVAGTGAWSTGDVKLTMKAVADSGWIMCADQTIGNAGSGATYANAAAEDLYTLLWTNVADAWAQVSTGRGGSAAADWAALKTITLTKMLGRALSISGGGAGLTARALGEYLGQEDAVVVTHTHAITDPTHAHGGGAVDPTFAGGGAPINASGGASVTSPAATGITITAAGVAAAGKNMQPSGFLNAMIKL